MATDLQARLREELEKLFHDGKNAGSDRKRDRARAKLKKLGMIRFDRKSWQWEILPAGFAALDDSDCGSMADFAGNLDASIRDRLDALSARIQELEGALRTERRRATDAEYMAHAYHNMLGPKGLEVAAMWDAKGVKRTHIDWAPEAGKLTGEERAQVIIDFNNAPSREMLPGEIDGDLPESIDIAARSALGRNADG